MKTEGRSQVAHVQDNEKQSLARAVSVLASLRMDRKTDWQVEGDLAKENGRISQKFILHTRKANSTCILQVSKPRQWDA